MGEAPAIVIPCSRAGDPASIYPACQNLFLAARGPRAGHRAHHGPPPEGERGEGGPRDPRGRAHLGHDPGRLSARALGRGRAPAGRRDDVLGRATASAGRAANRPESAAVVADGPQTLAPGVHPVEVDADQPGRRVGRRVEGLGPPPDLDAAGAARAGARRRRRRRRHRAGGRGRTSRSATCCSRRCRSSPSPRCR